MTPNVVVNEEWFPYSFSNPHAQTRYLDTNVSPSSFTPLSLIMQVPCRLTHLSSQNLSGSFRTSHSNESNTN